MFDKYINNSPADAEFAALNLPIEDITSRVLAPNGPVLFREAPPSISNIPPPLELYEPGEFLGLIADPPSQEEVSAPLIVPDPV